MAKCYVCGTRKGKRKCLQQDKFICSLCCGETRSAENCSGCSYFSDKKPIRNYRKAPHYPLNRMSNSMSLQNKAEIIEQSICKFDDANHRNLDDKMIRKIIELLLDRYYFAEENLSFSNKIEESGFNFMGKAIADGLSHIQSEDISKMLGTIHRSIERHDNRHRGYLDFLHDYL